MYWNSLQVSTNTTLSIYILLQNLFWPSPSQIVSHQYLFPYFIIQIQGNLKRGGCYFLGAANSVSWESRDLSHFTNIYLPMSLGGTNYWRIRGNLAIVFPYYLRASMH